MAHAYFGAQSYASATAREFRRRAAQLRQMAREEPVSELSSKLRHLAREHQRAAERIETRLEMAE